MLEPFAATEHDCLEGGLTPVLNSLDQVRRWMASAQSVQQRLGAALQFDNGMGLRKQEVTRILALPELAQYVNV
ncbi:alanine racemase [Variovorax ginsengisoli]|uniref:Alanine racemase n=1 Tax=Variovorax ginsengisoli TaxID=363844 RepID=A0ABT9SF48_9BURK|nr:alanine racemase [Variovorax ginsengisoli]MDP9902994.1 alanine racemase [Variovorax ginsengisoli]